MDSLVIFLVSIAAAACLLSSRLAGAADPGVFNVRDYGAKGDGNTVDSPAFTSAWKAMCASNATATLLIPPGATYLLQPLSFVGPCSSPLMKMEISGTLVAPMKQWDSCTNNGAWIFFVELRNVVIGGNGTINGNGAIWWGKQDANKSTGCPTPSGIRFHSCFNIQLINVHIQDSPRNHIGITGCQRMVVKYVSIIAPEHSPNTDGIDISSSSRVVVSQSYIATGDDCIAVNGGSKYINITYVACGPGHGISIGSLGKDGDDDSVEEIHVIGCNFTGTQNGARIKTWEGWTGHANKISFANITLTNTSNPILIDQKYCPRCPWKNNLGSVINEVTYVGFHGTSADPKAIVLNCSSSVGCHDITVGDVYIETVGQEKTYALCNDAYGTGYNTVPHVPCLSY